MFIHRISIVFALDNEYTLFSVLVEDSSPVTSWATGGTKTWVHLQKGFKSLVVPFASIAEKCAVHVSF